MPDENQTHADPNSLMRQLDDLDVELEIQSDHLKSIKILLIILVVLQLPVTALAVYGVFLVFNPIRF